MKKYAKLLTAAAAISASAIMTVNAYAAGWQHNTTGWWYGTNEANTAWYANGWQWIDGNNDGIAECYYFDQNGYILSSATTPDGYTVNADGAWTDNGVIKTKSAGTTADADNTSNKTTTNAQAPTTDIYSGTYTYKIADYEFSMKITYDPATQTLTDSEWIPGFGGITDIYKYAGVNEKGYTIFECRHSNKTAISGDSYIYFSAPGVMVVDTENGDMNVQKQ